MERRRSSPQQAAEFAVEKVGFFLRAERAGRKSLRKFSWLRKFVSVFLSMLLVCAYLVPHLLTGKISLLGARDVCRDKQIALAMIRNDVGVEEAAGFYEEYASSDLNPTHIFNAVPAFFSVGCFLLWTFFTPHHATSASVLDQKCAFTPPVFIFKCILNR